MADPFDLTGQVAFITGASSGMGRHMAMLLARHGAAVAIAARSSEKLAALVKDIEAEGGKAVAIMLDVVDREAIAPAVDLAEAALGPVTILINNAGIAIFEHAIEASPDSFDAMMAINLRGPYHLASEVGRRMILRECGGRVLNISSSAGLKPMAGFSAYGATKAGLNYLTQALALEWAKYHISVNALCPGYILTAMTGELAASEAGEKFRERLPRQRIGAPENLDCMVLAMVSPANDFMTGAIVPVDDAISVS